MYKFLMILWLPLILFFLVTFFYTWWIRGKGFGELLKLVRPVRKPPDNPVGGDRVDVDRD